MKIAIDAHSLGKKESTGIGTFARNLTFNLTDLGHEVYPIYSMEVNNKVKILAPSFFQYLGTKGEAEATDIKIWALCAAKYFFYNLALLQPRAELIKKEFNIEFNTLQNRLPAVAGYLNLPHLYRVSQAIAALLRKEILISLSNEVNPIDIFHLTMPLPVSLKKTKKVVTVHDLIPLKVPNATKINLKHYLNIIQTGLKSADIIFSVSEHTKKDLIEVLNVPEKKIYVTYQASDIPDEFLNLTDDDVTHFINYYNLSFKRYFLFYGAVEPKKNVLSILQSFVSAKTDCKLVILGTNGWLLDDVDGFIKRHRLNQNIIRIPYSDFRTVMYLLKGARALLFPSVYEGFGLPVLEAMQMGTPVITSHVTSLPEVGGTAVHYVDPHSIDDIKSAIETYSGSDEKLKKMSAGGIAQAEKFSAENYKKKLTQGYNLLFK